MFLEAYSSHIYFGLALYALSGIADWYTTKRRLVDQNLKAIERGEEAPHKEMNPVLRWVLGTPDKADEWRIALYRALLSLPLFYGVFFASDIVAPGWIYISCIPGFLAAANNKWNILFKLKKKLGLD